MDNIREQIKRCGLVPVIALQDAKDAVPLARALLAGGINVAEVTFRTDAAEASIKRIADEVPEMLVGAGTVLSEAQVGRAVASGAKFIVSPGMDVDVIRRAQELDVLVLPGVVTPTEIMTGLKEGIDLFKFFPAGNYGGLKTIKALAGPFTNISFIPTGGVSADNLTDYLSFDRVEAVGGSWMCPQTLIDAGEWDQITELALEAMKIRRSVE